MLNYYNMIKIDNIIQEIFAVQNSVNEVQTSKQKSKKSK